MFIYKITVTPINKVYIGLDTNPEYKQGRWKTHRAESKNNPRNTLHKAMNKYGAENCTYEVIDRDFTTVAELAIAEIFYIKQYNSFEDGLNGTAGGDGLNVDLTKFSEEEIIQIRFALGERWRKFNQDKWNNTTAEERKKLMQHCHTEEIFKKRAKTLKEYYKNIPGARDRHSAGIKQWQKENPELAKKYRIQNGLKGAEKTSKRVTLIRDNGDIEVYNSISEFQRKTGQWMCTIREKSQKGEFYNGYKIKDVE